MEQWWVSPRLRTDEEEGRERRAGFLELFFDLVVVALVAELAHGLAEQVDAAGVGRFLLLFLPTWWVWIGATYYVDRFETNDASHRVSLFALMVPVAGLAVFAHGAMETTSAEFALSYVVARLVIIALWLRGGLHNPSMRPVTNRYAAGFMVSVVLWLISIWVPPPGRYVLWLLGLGVDLLTPVPTLKFQARLPRLSQSHLPERFGLFTIIVLGESVVGVVAGVAGTERPTTGVLTAGALGLALAFGLWWLYFEEVGGRPVKPGVWQTARWGYGHMPLLAAMAAVGAGILNTVASGTAQMSGSVRWLIAGALAVAFAALGHLETTVTDPRGRGTHPALRLVAAGIAVAVGAVAGRLTGLGFLLVLVLLVAAQIVMRPSGMRLLARRVRSERSEPVGGDTT